MRVVFLRNHAGKYAAGECYHVPAHEALNLKASGVVHFDDTDEGLSEAETVEAPKVVTVDEKPAKKKRPVKVVDRTLKTEVLER